MDEEMCIPLMEYHVCLKRQNRRVNTRVHKKFNNKKHKRSRMKARKVYNTKKHNKKRKRIKLHMDTKDMITDIGYYC